MRWVTAVLFLFIMLLSFQNCDFTPKMGKSPSLPPPAGSDVCGTKTATGDNGTACQCKRSASDTSFITGRVQDGRCHLPLPPPPQACGTKAVTAPNGTVCQCQNNSGSTVAGAVRDYICQIAPPPPPQDCGTKAVAAGVTECECNNNGSTITGVVRDGVCHLPTETSELCGTKAVTDDTECECKLSASDEAAISGSVQDGICQAPSQDCGTKAVAAGVTECECNNNGSTITGAVRDGVCHAPVPPPSEVCGAKKVTAVSGTSCTCLRAAGDQDHVTSSVQDGICQVPPAEPELQPSDLDNTLKIKPDAQDEDGQTITAWNIQHTAANSYVKLHVSLKNKAHEAAFALYAGTGCNTQYKLYSHTTPAKAADLKVKLVDIKPHYIRTSRKNHINRIIYDRTLGTINPATGAIQLSIKAQSGSVDHCKNHTVRLIKTARQCGGPFYGPPSSPPVPTQQCCALYMTASCQEKDSDCHEDNRPHDETELGEWERECSDYNDDGVYDAYPAFGDGTNTVNYESRSTYRCCINSPPYDHFHPSKYEVTE